MKKYLLVTAVAASVVGGQVVEVSASTTYNVKPGDTLYVIALKNNLSVSELKLANHLNSDTIYSGQKLILGKATSSSTTTSTKTTTKSNNTYTVKSGDTLSKIASNHNMSLSQIATLNQISNVNVLRVGQVLKIAGTNITTNQSNAKTSSPEITTSTATYTVKSGDTLSKIASSNKMTLAQLATLNKITNVNMLRVGQVLKVTRTSSGVQPVKSTTTTTAKTSSTSSYTVKSGDTLSKIAANHHMSLVQIAVLNKITNLNAIRIGQILKVSGTVASTSQSAPVASKPTTSTSTTYAVKSGDTLTAIANKNGVTLSNLLSWNKLSRGAIIYPGQKLTLQQVINTTTSSTKSTTTTSKPTTTTNSYKVNSGETLYGIAAKLGMNVNTLLTLNGLKLTSTIYVGQVLKIFGATPSTVTPVTSEISTPVAGNISTAGLSIYQATWLKTAVADAKIATIGTGVLPSITVAQAILESGWGQSILTSAPYYNLFGIKQGTGWQGAIVNMKTSEYVNGKWVTISAPFRAYSSQMASFQDHTKFLLTNSRYAGNGVINAKNYVNMANGLQAAGYATDPTYANRLINLVERYNLQSLD
ncbi:LysM peptidoglycan-binding domain-containing protein [Leuconostoc gasicomitatum]|uniref:LysM peptidoglycan-binding domain-containing protein n=1 Tax=Leuconostoc gasicomitatum TaxID=115778 RepID=UPI000BC51462|nr:LysM peptidoglycan-binding domain-containing protein [Leuconostoc gasicomitatum]MBZ5944201.1 LysM peptidoglycan-binding domain-containing protein [Leuconostoc gasicomitatum]MBZ5946826.1 LysM peptidoglycan-binding domain-containing protein [Leuconostoc gasicomitatum]MBZ5950538.1 LysM peptidoglycan-binding domain-containing protein [Leuconostoc gasicomitatum]MBZ5950584.1 LysM peptidoglycan-binding domain-containing protein [Leuconostoc gasicomitatum]MBZ5967445.1 LysM peptidoglycan-binding dom